MQAAALEQRVRRVDGMDIVQDTYREFRAEPLLCAGVTQDWPLLAAPSVLHRVRELCGTARVLPLRLEYSDGVQCGHAVEEMSMNDLLDRDSEDEWHYLQWRDLPLPTESPTRIDEGAVAHCSADAAHGACALMEAVRRPSCISAAALRQANAWIGRSRTSHLHFDGMDNMLVVAHGVKEVLLFSPWRLPDLYPQSAQRWKSAAQSTTYLRPDKDDFPRLRGAPRLRATIRAGEALYIPAGWWHEVLTPTWTVAFNFWFVAHARARLRPTMLSLASDEYARDYAERVCDEREADATAQREREAGHAEGRDCVEDGRTVKRARLSGGDVERCE
jgi:hypothetical protein